MAVHFSARPLLLPVRAIRVTSSLSVCTIGAMMVAVVNSPAADGHEARQLSLSALARTKLSLVGTYLVLLCFDFEVASMLVLTLS